MKALTPSWIARILVALQFALVGLIVYLQNLVIGHPLIWGLLGSGTGLGIWALVSMPRQSFSVLPELMENTRLATKGPYRRVRHPMYTSVLLFMAAWLPGPWRWQAFALWFALAWVLNSKATREERLLAQRFPGYAPYCRHTWRFFPGW